MTYICTTKKYYNEEDFNLSITNGFPIWIFAGSSKSSEN